MSRRLTFILTVSALIALLLVQPSSAAIGRNTIDPEATLSNNGRQVTVTGPIACDEGEWLWIRLTVTQASSGAYAEGYDHLNCTGELQHWSVQAHARGFETFDEGIAEACALGITRERGRVTDLRQWCAANDITLETSQ